MMLTGYFGPKMVASSCQIGAWSVVCQIQYLLQGIVEEQKVCIVSGWQQKQLETGLCKPNPPVEEPFHSVTVQHPKVGF